MRFLSKARVSFLVSKNQRLQRLQQKEKHHTSYEVQCFFGGDYRDRTGDLLHAMQALSRTVSKRTPTRKCGDRLNFALIRSIHQKVHNYILLSGIMLRLQGNFTTQFSSVSMGFAQKGGHLREKIFSDNLLSAILILHIKVALFIFPKSIDKEVFSTMPMYFCCFLSMNQPHDP